MSTGKSDTESDSIMLSGRSISFLNSPRNPAPVAPSRTRWSAERVQVITVATTTEPSSADRPRLGRAEAEDAGLGRVDDRVDRVDPEHPEVRDGERPAVVAPRDAAGPRAPGSEVADFVRELGQALAVGVADHRRQSPASVATATARSMRRYRRVAASVQETFASGTFRRASAAARSGEVVDRELRAGARRAGLRSRPAAAIARRPGSWTSR